MASLLLSFPSSFLFFSMFDLGLRLGGGFVRRICYYFSKQKRKKKNQNKKYQSPFDFFFVKVREGGKRVKKQQKLFCLL